MSVTDKNESVSRLHFYGCATHPTVPAVGQCSSCGEPMCAQCINAGRRGDRTLCARCLSVYEASLGQPRARLPRKRDWSRVLRAMAIVTAFAVAVLGLAFVFRGAWLTAEIEGEAAQVAEHFRHGVRVREMREEARAAIGDARTEAGLGDFPEVAERVIRSVVRISTGGFLEARGSGFVVSNAGDILTAAHVVEGTDRPEVAFVDGSQFRGTVLRRNDRLDVALIHVEAEGLPALALGSSSNLRIGTEVAVAGFPVNQSMEGLGFRALTPTLVQGIVAARQSYRPTSISQPVRVLQIDANLNPGHSGGPVFIRSTGEVVGIANSSIEGLFTGKTDICFAVPIDSARRVIE